MKVYVVTVGEYSDREVVAVYDTHAAARLARDAMRECPEKHGNYPIEIEEFDLCDNWCCPVCLLFRKWRQT